jgi:hypothetical protein
MTRYSKASRGLSVLLRVNGIFTDNASSSGYSLRQSPTRYAIRAGRNLHDKEFRLALVTNSFALSPGDGESWREVDLNSIQTSPSIPLHALERGRAGQVISACLSVSPQSSDSIFFFFCHPKLDLGSGSIILDSRLRGNDNQEV